MVRDAGRQRAHGQVAARQSDRPEIERARLAVLQGEGGLAVLAGEPRYLVVVLRRRIVHVGVDGSWHVVQIVGHVESGRGERPVALVVDAVDVEITEGDDVVVPGVDLARPAIEPLCDRQEFGRTDW